MVNAKLIYKDINTKKGFSYSNKTNRYVLSITNNKFIKQDITLNKIAKLLKDFSIVKRQLNIKDLFVGFWNDDIYTYIDLNLSFDNLENSLIIAKMFNQIAIFDNLENKTINVF